METTFTELRSKEVINALTGKILGNICDVVMDLRCNRILGFVVPGSKNFFSFFKASQEIFIPFSHVCRIGEDIILVEVAEPPTKKQKNKPVRVFEVQEQHNSTNSTSTKSVYEQPSENKSTYPTSNYMANGGKQQNSQTGNSDYLYQNNSGVSKQFAQNTERTGIYPTLNVSSQCLNSQQNPLESQRNLYDGEFYDGYNKTSRQSPMTNFDNDDVYPIN